MHRRASIRSAASWTLALGALASACVRPDGAHAPMSGKELFAACVSCHGKDGMGMQSVAAPPIAGLPAWYVQSQLEKFRSDVRGAHPDDPEGLRMRPMSRQLMSMQEVRTVSEYVSTMPSQRAPRTLEGGNAAAGAAAYLTCAACHGAKGEGNQALSGPPLVGQADWYLLAQLRKFKSGVRGGNPKDVTGASMRPMALALPDEQAMLDVVTHIATFGH